MRLFTVLLCYFFSGPYVSQATHVTRTIKANNASVSFFKLIDCFIVFIGYIETLKFYSFSIGHHMLQV